MEGLKLSKNKNDEDISSSDDYQDLEEVKIPERKSSGDFSDQVLGMIKK